VTLRAAAVGARAGKATLRRRGDFAEDPLRLTRGSSLVAAPEGAEIEILEASDASGALAEIGAVFVETHAWLYPERAERTLAVVERVARRPYPTVNLDWD
jgi:hypothetical protein